MRVASRLELISPGSRPGSRPGTPSADSRPITPEAQLVRPMSRETPWITVPGSRQAPAVGICGPGSRKGRGAHSYDSQPAAGLRDGFGSLSRSATFDGALRSLHSSSSTRSVLLETRAGQRRNTRETMGMVSPSMGNLDAAYSRSQKARCAEISQTNSPYKKSAEPWKTAPGIGYGAKVEAAGNRTCARAAIAPLPSLLRTNPCAHESMPLISCANSSTIALSRP